MADQADKKEPSSTTTLASSSRNNSADQGKPAAADSAATASKPQIQIIEMDRTPTVGLQRTRTNAAGGQDNTLRRVLTVSECPEVLGFAFPPWKKWLILTVIFLVQTSMNFNTSLYANGQAGLAREFGIAEQTARWGAAAFLMTYAFGCELWAPWSEEFGRKPILQASLLLVNACGAAVALAPSWGVLCAFRALGGLFSAGGSITLGVVADMYTADDQQHAVAFVVLSSVGGSIFGPVVGGFVEEALHWRWAMWIQVFLGVLVQVLHAWLVPETRSASLVDEHARRLRRSGRDPNAYGPRELRPLSAALRPREVLAIWARPFKMFVTEPIVLVLSLLSGFSDALIFMGFQSFGLVYKLWRFSPSQIGLTFLAIGLGYLLAYLSFLPAIARNAAQRAAKPHSEYARFESRLWWLMYTAPCLPVGLLIFAWTSTPAAHWSGPVIGSAVIGVANYAVYMATIDYMVAAYGPYSASATGGNGFARDFLAGVLTMAAFPYYDALKAASPGLYLQLANTILAAISLVLVIATVWIYLKGSAMRKRSTFAQVLASEAEAEAAAASSSVGAAGPVRQTRTA